MWLKQSLCLQVVTLLTRQPGLSAHLLQVLSPTAPRSRSRQKSSIQIPATTLRLTRTLSDVADAAASKMQTECSLYESFLAETRRTIYLVVCALGEPGPDNDATIVPFQAPGRAQLCIICAGITQFACRSRVGRGLCNALMRLLSCYSLEVVTDH